MIVISNALALSPSLVLSANHPVVGWQNLVTAGGIAADHEDADYPAVNLANPSTSVKQQWRSDSTAEQYVTFTVTSESEVDYVGIARHNFGSAQIEVSVEYPDPDNEGEWLELIEPHLLANDEPAIFRFEPTFLSTIRLKMVPDATAPRLAVCYVGKLLVLQRKIYVGHTPLNLGCQAEVQTDISESGEFLGRTLLREERSTSVSLQNLTPDWYRENMAPFVLAARSRPFFFAWRPSEYPEEAGFAWATNSPRPVNQRSNGMVSVSLSIGGLGE